MKITDPDLYTRFHDLCGIIESRFGNQCKLALKPQLDLSVVQCNTLLDFGAGKGLNSGLCKNYVTFDTDAKLNSTYCKFEEMPPELMFDGIIANQVFEHLVLNDLSEAVGQLTKRMKPGAKILATIPNVHRGSYFFNDIDHKTPLMYYHVGALFELYGLKVIDSYRYAKRYYEIVNVTQETQKLFELLSQFYELDPAQFLAIVALKE